MSQKARVFTTEELQSMGFVNTTSRAVRRLDCVDVRCSCGNEDKQVPFSQVIAKVKTSGAWRCRDCFKKALSEIASQRTGEKNSFYGKKHTKEAAKKRHDAYKEWVKNNPDQVKENTKKARTAFKEHYSVNNPMDLEEFKNNQRKATQSEEFKKKSSINTTKRYQDPEERRKTGELSKKFFNSEKGQEIKKQKANEFREKNYNDSVWNNKRITNLNIKTEQKIQDGTFPLLLPEVRERAAERRPEYKPEREIRELLESFGLVTKKLEMGGKEIDVFVPSLNIGIEHNGVHCHNELHRDRHYHIKKTEYFLTKNIRIIQVWDHEWSKRKEQVSSYIKSLCNKNEIKIGARNVEIVQIDYETSKKLCDEWHIQGGTKGVKLALAAKYKGEFIGVVTFGNHHRINDGTIVLNRLCFKPNVTIVGFLSKVSKLASSFFKKDIFTWADRRFSEGNGYKKSGWELVNYLEPDYFYTDKLGTYMSKQSRQKKIVNTPEGMTELQHAIIDGKVRVWDCGKIKFVYKYNP